MTIDLNYWNKMRKFTKALLRECKRGEPNNIVEINTGFEGTKTSTEFIAEKEKAALNAKSEDALMRAEILAKQLEDLNKSLRNLSELFKSMERKND